MNASPFSTAARESADIQCGMVGAISLRKKSPVEAADDLGNVAVRL